MDKNNAKHLLAQIQYKLGDFKASVNLYENLFHVTQNEDSDLADILTNMIACASNT